MSGDVKESIKQEDRKSIKKYVIIMICCFLGGGLVGFFTGFVKDSNILEITAQQLEKVIRTGSLYGNLLLAVVTAPVVITMLIKSKKLYAAWDEEDDSIMHKIENSLNIGLMITNIASILGIVFLIIGIDYVVDMIFEEYINPVAIVIFAAGTVANMLFGVIAQQRIVNLEKEMNPEKQGSVFDFNFTKRWVGSCDEAELLKIYQCGYASFRTTQVMYYIFLFFCLFGMYVWDFGVFPVCMVCIMWIVTLTSYYMKAMQLEKR